MGLDTPAIIFGKKKRLFLGNKSSSLIWVLSQFQNALQKKRTYSLLYQRTSSYKIWRKCKKVIAPGSLTICLILFVYYLWPITFLLLLHLWTRPHSDYFPLTLQSLSHPVQQRDVKYSSFVDARQRQVLLYKDPKHQLTFFPISKLYWHLVWPIDSTCTSLAKLYKFYF